MSILWKLFVVCCMAWSLVSVAGNSYLNSLYRRTGPDFATDIKINFSNSKDILEQLLFHIEGSKENSCLLDNIRNTKLWWTFPNGTLRHLNVFKSPVIAYADMSHLHLLSDDALFVKFGALEINEVVVFSAACNNLASVPKKTLSLFSDSLKYLTLTGNKFSASSIETSKSDTNTGTYENNSNSSEAVNERLWFNGAKNSKIFNLFSKRESEIAWAQFPHLPNLLELDISNCQIEFVTKDAFRNLSNLRSLYMSRNKLMTIPFDTFFYVQSIHYLDLAHINFIDAIYQKPKGTLDGLVNMVYGLKIQQTTFKYLPNLVYLDLSRTRLTKNSVVAFSHFGEQLRYLSLCYTTLPVLNNALFKHTALVGLDLSGNTYAAYSMTMDAFESLADTLKYLYFERSNLKDMSWIRSLKNLRVLSVAGNNINSLTLDIFGSLTDLHVLDLGGNHVGNWYSRVFSNNSHLRVINLRENNINIITSEMLKDFSELDYLSIGNNNFVCDCMLKDMVDLTSLNTKKSECSLSLKRGLQNIINIKNYPKYDLSYLKNLNFSEIIGNEYISSIMLSESVKRIISGIRNKIKPKIDNKIKYVLGSLRSRLLPKECQPTETQSVAKDNSLNGFLLKFELLDYQEENYWCFNETERTSFTELSCQQRSFVNEVTGRLHILTIYLIGSLCTILAISVIGLIIYFKRWHIYYYYSSFKSAALLSAAVKENFDKLSTMCGNEPSMLYDIFISYSQNDREWVFKELLPNVEESGDIQICLHERDFQIGVTILDNIISCMERSRGLMLIISSSFLLSHWCQFEMHLAQHRIFETSHKHLILVFLEEIPRHKRPKHLQYLMDVKTYIKWPGALKQKTIRLEDQKIFWKRLRRSLNDICK